MDSYAVKVTVTMTDEQVADYAREYGWESPAAARADAMGRLSESVAGALKACYWLSELAAADVSSVMVEVPDLCGFLPSGELEWTARNGTAHIRFDHGAGEFARSDPWGRETGRYPSLELAVGGTS